MFSPQQLFKLRAIAVLAQLIVLCSAVYLLRMDLPLLPILLVIGFYAFVGLISFRLLRESKLSSGRQLMIHLALDIVALVGLLSLAGGATNPFVSLLLLPLVLAAATLSQRSAGVIAALVVASYTLLMFFYIPLPKMHTGHNSMFDMHILGMWFSFIFSVVLIAVFVTTMAARLRARDRAVAEAEARELQNQHIVAMGTFAAGAAHELGTPLATMAVLANEMKTDSVDAEQQRNAQILREQIDRCKEILTQVSAQSGDIRAEGGRKQYVEDFLDELVRRWKEKRNGVQLVFSEKGVSRSAYILSDATLFQAFSNLLNNAADASPESINVQAKWNDKSLEFRVCDYGKGIEEISALDFSRPSHSSKPLGQGLGLFLTNAVVNRFGGSFDMRNRDTGGVCARIILPLDSFDREVDGRE